MKKPILGNNHGFSLLEMAIVVIIMTILISAAIPALTRAYLEKAANKTALEINTIEEAARAYYVNNNAWPGSISGNPMGDLMANSYYLPATWNAVNPFGASSNTPANYSYNITTNGDSLTVSTYVPAAAQLIIQNLLPTRGTPASGDNVASAVSVPGASQQMKYYDSGWFYLNNSSAVTLTHNLNTTNFTYTIWASNSSSGSSPYTLLQASYGATRGIVITNATSTTITVVGSIPSQGNSFWTLNTSGQGISTNSVYCRIILTVIP